MDSNSERSEPDSYKEYSEILMDEESKLKKEDVKPFLNFLKGKRIYLSLSGGGLALVCHISIIRIIEELGINVERVYGTSAGSVIGGLYAAGLGWKQMRDAALRLKKPDDLFGFGSKHIIIRAIKSEIEATFKKSEYPRAAIYNNKRLESYIESNILRFFGRIPLLGELKLPFSAIAFDIGDDSDEGHRLSSKKVFSTENTPEVTLKDAIVASISIPGVFPPKEIGSHYYIDGGVVENLPIVTAYEDWIKRKRFYQKNLVIIGVDLGYGGETLKVKGNIKPHDLLIYAFSVEGKTINQYSLLRVHKPRKGSNVVLLKPRCYDIGLTDFEKIPEAMVNSYDRVCEQIKGKRFLNETKEDIEKAKIMLGINEKI